MRDLRMSCSMAMRWISPWDIGVEASSLCRKDAYGTHAPLIQSLHTMTTPTQQLLSILKSLWVSGLQKLRCVL